MDINKHKGLNQGAEGKNKDIEISSFESRQFRNSYDESMETTKAVRHQDQECTPELCEANASKNICNTTRPSGVPG